MEDPRMAHRVPHAPPGTRPADDFRVHARTHSDQRGRTQQDPDHDSHRHDEVTLRLIDRKIWFRRDRRDTTGQAPLLILLDGQRWRSSPATSSDIGGLVVHMALVDTLDDQRRARDLTSLERLQLICAAVLDVAQAHLNRALDPHQVAIAGHEHGGLAAALMATCRPDLVGRALIQSGSLWYRPGSPNSYGDKPGELVDYLRSRAGAMGLTGLCGRARPSQLAVQVGTDETWLHPHIQAFCDSARAAGLAVDYREYRSDPAEGWRAEAFRDGLSILLS